MDHQKVQILLETLEKNQLSYQDTLSELVECVIELNHENNRLRMRNDILEEKLKIYASEQIAHVHNTQQIPSVGVRQPSGQERLQSFYDDGIHVCHELFGQRRESNEECLFCQNVIMSLDQGGQ